MTASAGIPQINDALLGYIARNSGADPHKLLLKREPQPLAFDKSFAVLQIECRQRTRHKIPALLAHGDFLFPTALSAEQCTHQAVAQWHATLFDAGDHVLDMTMGLGVDALYISGRVASLTAIERDPLVAAVGQHNMAALAPGVQVICADSAQWLASHKEARFDAIFIDPARRDQRGGRVYGLADCQPDVLALLPLLKQRCRRLVVKASPMLDVTQCLRDLGTALVSVSAVSVRNECKELLLSLDFEASHPHPTLHALDHDGGTWHRFTAQEAAPQQVDFPAPQAGDRLYEPGASVMKLGCFAAVAAQTGTQQLAPNSHLMVSHEVANGFPGRGFVIERVIPFHDRELKPLRKQFTRLNVATRNFRISADALKRRLHVTDGGDRYLFASTLATGEQTLLLCHKA